MTRLKLVILFGGCSEEHDISVKSAMEIASSVDTQKYEPLYIGITKGGAWKLCARPYRGWADGDSRGAVLSPDRETRAVITVPADLPATTRTRIRETAKSIYAALGCRGLARVDMFLKEDGCIVLNEVNTLPGFTSYSRYPRMMAAAGMDLCEVIDRCISLATTR